MLHPEDPAPRSTINHQVSKAWGILLQVPQAVSTPGPCQGVPATAGGCLPFSVISFNILYSVIPSAGRKHQAEASHRAESLPQGIWCEFSHPFDFPPRRACQAGDHVLQQGRAWMENSVPRTIPCKIVSKMYSCTFLYIQIPLSTFSFRHKYLVDLPQPRWDLTPRSYSMNYSTWV